MLDIRSEIQEGLRYQKLGMLEQALQRFQVATDGATEPAIIGEGLCRQALVYRAWCRWDEAIGAARRSAAIALGARLDEQYAEALNAEAIVHQERGVFDEAIALYEIIARMRVSDRVRGLALQNLGSIAGERAELDRADAYFRESQRCFSKAGYAWGVAFALNNQAAVALYRGRFKEAEVLAGQSIVAAKKVGDLELIGIASLNAAEALASQNRVPEAERMALDALRYFEIEESELRRAQAYRVCGDLRLLQGDRDKARQFYIDATALAERVGSQREVERIRDAMEVLNGA